MTLTRFRSDHPFGRLRASLGVFSTPGNFLINKIQRGDGLSKISIRKAFR